MIKFSYFLLFFSFKVNIHIVFEGEKEFHRSVKLWGVSIKIFFLSKSNNQTKNPRRKTKHKHSASSLSEWFCFTRYSIFVQEFSLHDIE